MGGILEIRSPPVNIFRHLHNEDVGGCAKTAIENGRAEHGMRMPESYQNMALRLGYLKLIFVRQVNIFQFSGADQNNGWR